MLTCPKCKQERNKASFFKGAPSQERQRFVRDSICYECRQAKRAYEREYYHNNPKRKKNVIARANKVKHSLKEKGKGIIKIFKSRPCMDCKVAYPSYVMDLDHRDKTKKEFTISMWTCGTLNLESLQTELNKCDVVCSNCHRERTNSRR
jgi:hypothetical protein